MSRRRKVKDDIKYTTLPSTYDTQDGIDPVQFETPKPKFPLKTVIFILFFMLIGGICLTIAALISSGAFGDKYDDRILPLFILGGMMFIPGGYYGWIVFNVLFGRGIYTVDDIPAL